MFCLVACGKSGAPTALADDQIGDALTKAFEKSPAATKSLIQEVIALFVKKEYMGASGVITAVLGQPTLTELQRATATMTQMNLNEKMRTAVAKGDDAAAEVQKIQMLTK